MVTVNNTAAAQGVSTIAILPHSSSPSGVYTALQIDLQKGWDTYWCFAGEAGVAPNFKWQEKSRNIKAFNVYFPAPARFSLYGIDSFVYKDAVTFPVEVEFIDPSLPAQLELEAEIFVCNGQCVPEKHSLTFEFNRTEPVVPNNPYAANLPQKISGGKAWLGQNAEGKNTINLSFANVEISGQNIDMFVESAAGFTVAIPQITKQEGEVTLSAAIRNAIDLNMLKTLIGEQPLRFTVADGSKAYEFETALSEAPPTAQEATFNLHIILLALLGGLVLNLMPCVLPVITLKLLSILKHGNASRGEIVKSFAATSLGILCSFWVIAAGLVTLRTFGYSIGWGIQFQYPSFIIFLMVITLVFALNLLGLFSFVLPSKLQDSLDKASDGKGFAANFMSGALATLLATPCSAPFLGTAVAFALGGSSLDIFTIFTMMALGLALPYMLLALMPQLFKYLPRSGQWMLHLRKFLGLTLIATFLWLASILVGTYGNIEGHGEWIKFDEAVLQQEVSLGKTVFVNISADWCLTCKVNYALVLGREATEDFLRSHNVVLMHGDWTKRDETITQYLQKHARYGIPFYAIYGKNAPQGITLPELISFEDVKSAIEKAE